jgi:hypothetical protein
MTSNNALMTIVKNTLLAWITLFSEAFDELPKLVNMTAPLKSD